MHSINSHIILSNTREWVANIAMQEQKIYQFVYHTLDYIFSQVLEEVINLNPMIGLSIINIKENKGLAMVCFVV